MRTFLIIALALFATVSAKSIQVSPRDEEDAAEAFIWCVIDALDGGLPEAGIPEHNPLKFHNNMSFPLGFLGLNGTADLYDVYIEHIVDIEIRNLTGQYSEDGQSIVFQYGIYWEEMNIHGDFETAFQDLLGYSHEYEGTFNLTLQDLLFAGTWDMSAGDVSPRVLNNFTLWIQTSATPFETHGLGLLLDPIFSETVSLGLNFSINAEQDLISSAISPVLLQRFNDAWLSEDNTYRIDAILANCNGAPTTTEGPQTETTTAEPETTTEGPQTETTTAEPETTTEAILTSTAVESLVQYKKVVGDVIQKAIKML